MRRRTYRAHGRINPYMSSPCHIEMILTEKEQIVPKPEEEVAQKKKVHCALISPFLLLGCDDDFLGHLWMKWWKESHFTEQPLLLLCASGSLVISIIVLNCFFFISFVGFPEEAEEAETHGSGVNVNKFQHLNYSGLMCFIAWVLVIWSPGFKWFRVLYTAVCAIKMVILYIDSHF